MRKSLSIILLILLCSLVKVQAEIVVLQSGKTMEGDILIQNDDIVMLRDKEGHKFQFPRAEVAEIQVTQVVQVAEEEVKEEAKSEQNNCALRLDMGGGALFIPTLSNGGYGAVDIQIGTRRIGQRRIFLGGSVGYQAAIADKVYNFLPLMVVCSLPLLEGKHAPEIGACIGYSFAIKQPNKGGVVTKLDISWRYQFAPTSALLLGVQARFQQAKVGFDEIVDGKSYTSVLGKNLVGVGLKLALEF